MKIVGFKFQTNNGASAVQPWEDVQGSGGLIGNGSLAACSRRQGVELDRFLKKLLPKLLAKARLERGDVVAVAAIGDLVGVHMVYFHDDDLCTRMETSVGAQEGTST